MGGGLMQLVAYGAQDIYLTGNPQITFFKVVYRRHTNFSMEAIEQTMNGTTAADGNQTCTVSRNGDLVHSCYITMQETFADASATTLATADVHVAGGAGAVYDLVESVEIEIGGQRIDKHYGDWNAIWWELTTSSDKRDALRSMLLQDTGYATNNNNAAIYPLNFWFCRNPGLALPLIALQYHEVKLKFTWGPTSPTSVEVWCDYIYLDTDERRRFAQVSHEYLIEQVQRETSAGNTSSMTLNFNHPVKELIWVNARGSTGSKSGCEFFPIGHAPATDTTLVPDGGEDDLKMKLQLNGHDRMAYRDAKYYKTTQLYQHHTHCPAPTEHLHTFVAQSTRPTNGCFFLNDRHIRLTDVWQTGESDSATSAQHIVKGGAVVAAGAIVSEVQITDNYAQNAGNAARSTFENTSSDRYKNIVPALYGLGLDLATVTDKNRVFTIRYEELPILTAGDCDNMANIYCYSFALKPEEHQPSGTCNFSRIDNAKLMSDTDMGNANSTIKVFAVNYNVLRIMSGMGGLAYSN
jgi:hypothetical protein